MAAVLASRFSIREHGAVVKEVSNVRICSEPLPCLQYEFLTFCTNLKNALLPNASYPHVSMLIYNAYNFLQFYFISFQNKLYGCLLDRVDIYG